MLFEKIAVLTQDEQVQPELYVAVQGDSIAYVGRERPKGDFGRRYDGRGKLLMPGLVNAHSHAPMTLLRGYAEGLSLQAWLNERVFPFEARLTGQDVYFGSLLAYAEMLRFGVTASADMYFFGQDMAKAVLDSGMRANICLSVTCFDDRAFEELPVYEETLRLLEKELLFAQRNAEEEFQKRFKYSRGNTAFETDPAFLSLLGESVAQRLETGFMPMLSTADRVRLLKVLMHGVFAGPVDWGELHTAVLFREIREALKECSPSMDHVELYGEMKKTLQECARQAAQEAASHSIVSPVLLRGLFIDELKHFSPRFFENGKVMKEWDRLIKFFQQKQPPHAR